TESYAEQAFWSQYSVQTDEPTHSGTTIVEVPKELPKVSMVNSCLKKLKSHLARFDIVVKERTTATAITEGTWGFEHTKACFRNDIIPFMKNLKDLFTSFDQYLIDEVSEVQKTFKQMEMAVEQNCAAKSEFQSKMETVLKENDLLLKHALGVDIVNIVVNNCMNVYCLTVDACEQCVTTESELETDLIEKENYEMLLKQYNTLEKHCISLELNNQLNTELFQRDNVSPSESGPNFADLFEINELKAQIQEKDTVILKLKEKIKSLRADDKEIKERTTATAITEGTWGFEHRKACFHDDIIPFVKNLKELFTSFDQYLIDEVNEVQKIFKQMEMAVEQHYAEKIEFQTKMENVLKENDRLLTHALGVEIVNIVVNDCMNRDTVSSSESAPTFAELFETNELKAQIQEKDMVILKLKEKIKSSSADVKERKTYKQLYDSIKSACVQSKEQCDDLINKVNLKSAKVSDLNASLQEKVLVITTLKAQLNKLKGKAVLTEDVSLNPIDPELLKVDVAPLVSKLPNARKILMASSRATSANDSSKSIPSS
nr:hypothetical protein [Tanacetum cinerariifolium]